MMKWFRMWRDRYRVQVHTFYLLDWAWAMVAQMDELQKAVAAADKSEQDRRIDWLLKNAKPIYLKGKFHLYRGPLKSPPFGAWIDRLDDRDALGIKETPDQRANRWPDRVTGSPTS